MQAFPLNRHIALAHQIPGEPESTLNDIAGSSSYGEVVAVSGQGITCLRCQFNNIISRKRRVSRSMLRRVRDLPKEYIEALLDFYALQGDRQQQT